jgi:phosphate/sulfate permease
MIAYWVSFLLLPTFAQFKVNVSSNLAFYVLVICNAATVPGRYLAVPVSTRSGPAPTMVGFSFASAVMLYGWIGASTIPWTIVWAVFIALFMAPLSAIYPIMVPHLSLNKELFGTTDTN